MISNSTVNLPPFISVRHLSDMFTNFFMRKRKITRKMIISNSSNNICVISMDANIMLNGKMLKMFRPISEVEAKGIMTKSPNKRWDLDLWFSWLLMKCADHLLSLITAIINRSMGEPVMLLCLKRPTITPLLKRSGLDKEFMANYILISIPLYVSYLLKR